MTVSVFYPDADAETTSVDGFVGREGALFDEDLATIRAGAGVFAFPSDNPLEVNLIASSTTDQFKSLYRMFLLFDTSAIGDADTISAAVIGLDCSAKTTDLGAFELDIVASTPASNTNLVTGDYGNVGSTPFSSLGTGSISTTGYNDFTLDAGGIAAITKTGVSKFGARINWDTDNSFTGTWSILAAARLQFNSSEDSGAGTTSDPKLTVTHAAAVTFTPRAVVIT